MTVRTGWVMGALAVGAALTAAGLGVAGMRTTPTPPEAGRLRTGPISPEDTDPNAPRLFDQSEPIRIHVAGAVRKPGVYSLPSWARVMDAVKKAGGAAPGADLDAINLADPVKDGEQLRVPYRGRGERSALHPPTPEPGEIPPDRGGLGSGRYPFAAAVASVPQLGASPISRSTPGPAPPAEAAAGSAPVDVNTATAEDLRRLPGVGDVTAAAILEHRREYGRFQQVEDLMNVKGIGRVRFERLKTFVTVR